MYQQQASPMYPQPSPVYMQPTPVMTSQPMFVQSPAPMAMIQNIQYGSDAVCMVCPRCQHNISTYTKAETGTCTFVSCITLGIFSAGLFSFIPFCFDTFKDVKHTCPSCGAYLGTYKRL